MPSSLVGSEMCIRDRVSLLALSWFDWYFLLRVCERPPRRELEMQRIANLSIIFCPIIYLCVAAWMYGVPALVFSQ
eukprot:6213335-Prorocentrum_lima.AAC.1